MNIKEIGHLAFTCADLDASVAFYRDKLGFTTKFTISYGELLDSMGPSPDPETAARLGAIRDRIWISYMDVGNGQFVELFDKGSATIPCVPTGAHLNYNHLALLVDDIHAAHAELVEKGVPIDTPPKLGLEGTWQMWSHDPDGNKIEFMQYTAASWQLTGKK